MDYKGPSGHRYEALNSEQLQTAHAQRARELEAHLFVLELEKNELYSVADIATEAEMAGIEQELTIVKRKIDFGLARLAGLRMFTLPDQETTEE